MTAMNIRRVPLSDLHEDVANVRLHDEKNLATIKASLLRFKQVEPLVVQRGSMRVIGGNGRLQAMRDLKWEFADVYEVDLQPSEQTALGIVLNRSSELAKWDEKGLSDMLGALKTEGFALGDLGFGDDEFAKLANGGGGGTANGSTGASSPSAPGATGLCNLAYQPPFPWFGGKSAVANVVWAALGNPKNYVEPFFGSGAVLFLRPDPPAGEEGQTRIETVNDVDCFVSNFWRALKKDQDAVADAADWPVNEADLSARHLWLVGQRPRITERLMGDPEFFDAIAAGWWAWGMSCWIGSGWCSGTGPWIAGEDGAITDSRKLPQLINAGRGVNRQLPHLGDAGRGVNRQLPHLGDAGQGVQPQAPEDGGDPVGACAAKSAHLRAYLGRFADRLREVRVCCGDWARVSTPAVMQHHGTTGVFLDPPYADSAARTDGLYAKDDLQVAHAVREWAVANGDDPNLRIVLAGYDGEHAMPASWRIFEWATPGGYASFGADDKGNTGKANKRRERLWFSPHCLDVRGAVVAVLEPENAGEVVDDATPEDAPPSPAPDPVPAEVSL